MVTTPIFKMDPPTQYRRRAQMSCSPMDFQYTGSPMLPPQADGLPRIHPDGLPRIQPDGLPRIQPDEQLMNTWTANILSNNFILNPTPITQSPAEWTAQPPTHVLTDYGDQNSNEYYRCSTVQHDETGRDFPRSLSYANIPRTWPLPYDTTMAYEDPISLKTYEPSVYLVQPDDQTQLSQNSENVSGRNSSLGHDMQERLQNFTRLSISRSSNIRNGTITQAVPSFDKSSGFVFPSRESSDDSGNSSREDRGVDESYAKLIYRALMSAPNNSMVLQEIYQWFRDNTAKGSSDTKGWMNSVRHNLSMNAAFKKTQRKVSGDETKKPTEWVLEDFAIKDGIQSTTRYRKGTGNKKLTNSANPALSRQTSGRKGGICASKTRFSRQKVKDDRSDRRRSLQRLDTGRHPYQQKNRAPVNEQQISPLTPSPESFPSSSPYFLKSEHFDVPYEDLCGLEDVEGVYAEESPLFSNCQESPFHNPRPMCSSQSF